MKITQKIYLLVLVSLLASFAISGIASVLKNQGMQYFRLVDEVRALEVHVLKILSYKINYEHDAPQDKEIFESLLESEAILRGLDSSLLSSDAQKMGKLEYQFILFRSSFEQIVESNKKMSGTTAEIYSLVDQYKVASKEASTQINDALTNSFLFSDVETPSFQELSHSVLSTISETNRLLLSIHQDLLSGINRKRFETDSQTTLQTLDILESKIWLQVQNPDLKDFMPFSESFSRLVEQLNQLVGRLQNDQSEREQISINLQNHQSTISQLVLEVTEEAETIREQQQKTINRWQWVGEGLVILLLLVGAFFISRSIFHPLELLTATAQSLGLDGGRNPDDSWTEEEELLLNETGEVGDLFRAYRKMMDRQKQSYSILQMEFTEHQKTKQLLEDLQQEIKKNEKTK